MHSSNQVESAEAFAARRKAHFDCEGDEIAHHFLSAADLAMSPEEYAARKSHLWGCYSLHEYRYRDLALGAWVRRLGEIIFSEEEVERCRQQFLTPEELAEVHRKEQEEF